MKQIEEMINKNLETKFNDGTIEKMIDESVNKMIKNVLDNATSSYSEPATKIEKKIKEIICQSIENYDFSQYLIKITDVLDRVLTADLIKDNRRIANNLETILNFKRPEKDISMETIFEKYCDWVKDELEVDYKDCDYTDDGETCVHCMFEKDKDNYNYYFKTFTDKDEEVEDYTINLSLYESYNRKINIAEIESTDENISSIRYLNKFVCYLMLLKQNYCDITDVKDYEEDIFVKVSY